MAKRVTNFRATVMFQAKPDGTITASDVLIAGHVADAESAKPEEKRGSNVSAKLPWNPTQTAAQLQAAILAKVKAEGKVS